jgi:hypothetical protein
VKRPSSEGSMSRIRSPRGRVRTARVKGPEWLRSVMAEAESLTDFIVLVIRSMWSVNEGMMTCHGCVVLIALASRSPLVRRIGGDLWRLGTRRVVTYSWPISLATNSNCRGLTFAYANHRAKSSRNPWTQRGLGTTSVNHIWIRRTSTLPFAS